MYATHKSGQRIGGTQDGDRVLVHIVNGGMVGWFNLARFDGGTLTTESLASL